MPSSSAVPPSVVVKQQQQQQQRSSIHQPRRIRSAAMKRVVVPCSFSLSLSLLLLLLIVVYGVSSLCVQAFSSPPTTSTSTTTYCCSQPFIISSTSSSQRLQTTRRRRRMRTVLDRDYDDRYDYYFNPLHRVQRRLRLSMLSKSDDDADDDADAAEDDGMHWSLATIQSVVSACESGASVWMRMQVPVETSRAYTVPGQYVQVRYYGPPTSSESEIESSESESSESASASASASASTSSFSTTLFLAMASAPPIIHNEDKAVVDMSKSESASSSLCCFFDFLIKKNANNAWLTQNDDPNPNDDDDPNHHHHHHHHEAAAKARQQQHRRMLGVGSVVYMSRVLGAGFRIAEQINGYAYDFPTQYIVLLAAGSGIAPIKAALESGLLLSSSSSSIQTKSNANNDNGMVMSTTTKNHKRKNNSGRTCRLYYGERTAADLCFVDQFPLWEEMGYEIVPVLSQPFSLSLSTTENMKDEYTDNNNNNNIVWQGRTGYVQNALEEDGIPIPRNVGALVCGMKGMAEAVKTLLLQAGVFEGRILFNF